ncbi:MAG: hypothetical protein ACE5FM_09870 [Methyloligellaceae bacterium]
MPSKEHDGSSVVSLRLPDTLLARLDRCLDWFETHRGEKSSRNHARRQALTQWLDTQEEQGGITHPDVLRRYFHAAYTSLRSGQDEVHIHRIRHLLNWPPERFDAVLEQLRAELQVVLHVGDPSVLSDDQRRHSYGVNGQLYLSLSWQESTAMQISEKPIANAGQHR